MQEYDNDMREKTEEKQKLDVKYFSFIYSFSRQNYKRLWKI